ncbi:hypothetical protein G7Y89_g15396 [Cudoniella acicularis]|uniref:Aldehyde dehydrogenase domain-containing protein n=1 Tax=Cudoniella acicularis TaxID=354080 RepID=A0A8H4QNT2_9HELO|nr:hypothetical protein G7Y89_g15396 [Cudoniella acicularis]
MLSPENIFVPLIIDGKDVQLPDASLTFTPESRHGSARSQAHVVAQGANTEMCNAAVDSSARALEAWRNTAPQSRRALLLRLAHLLRERGDEIHRTMQDEIHATSRWSMINLDESIAMIEETAAAVTSSSLAGSMPPTQNPESQALVYVEPLGVILGIAPWNSPLILGLRAILPAIASGNTVILKGSELSPRTHYFIASLVRDAGFPPGVCNFLLHRASDAAGIFETIIQRHEVRKCNFTGSTPVGRAIASRAAAALKPCLMELGGKNYAIVLADADVAKAARMVCEGAFLNNGQICMSTDTAIVASSIFVQFRQAILDILQGVDTTPEVTPLITSKAAARVRALVADAASKGAIIHTSSGSSNGATYAKPPTGSAETAVTLPATILENIDQTMDLYTQESFGPLLCLLPVESEEEAVKIVNACRYGLSSAIHSESHYRALSIAKRMKVSAVHINGATVHDESTLPHGGQGDSGWGRFGAGWGLQEFVHTKTCDGLRPKCSGCAELGFECVYVNSASSSNVIVGKEYLSGLENRLRIVEQDIGSLKSSQKRQPQQTRFDDELNGRAYRDGLEPPSSLGRLRGEEVEVNSEDLQEATGPESGADGMGAMIFSTEEDCGFFGMCFALVQLSRSHES